MCFNWCRCIDCVGLLALSIDNYLHKDPRRILVASQNDPRGSLRQFMASPTFQKESHRVMKESLKKPQKIPENPRSNTRDPNPSQKSLKPPELPNSLKECQKNPTRIPKRSLNPQKLPNSLKKYVKRIPQESQKDP